MSANPPNQDRPGSQMVQVPRSNGTAIARESATGGREIQLSGETSTMATAAMARAQIEARYAIARQYPRSVLEGRQRLLAACARSRFAEVAIYHKPVGKGIEGPSIRLAEEAARCMGNIDSQVETVYDDREKRILRVSAIDLESNLSYWSTVVVTKTVERSKVPKGQVAISQRYNSQGELTYEVPATDDDILNKVNSLASKALRVHLLRLVPGDVMEDAVAACYDTRRQKYSEDPAAEVRRMTDAFLQVRVNVRQLAEYLGHDVESCALEEVDHMRNLYAAIKDGETTWTEALDKRREEMAKPAASTTGAAPTGPADASGSGPVQTPQTPPPAKNLSDVAANAAAARGAAAPGAPQTRQQVIDKARAGGRTTYEWEGKTHKVPPIPANKTAAPKTDLDQRHEGMISGPPPATNEAPPLDKLDGDAPEPGSEG